MVVVRLSWLSGRGLAIQARGVLGWTPSYFRLITSKFIYMYFQCEARYYEQSCKQDSLADWLRPLQLMSRLAGDLTEVFPCKGVRG